MKETYSYEELKEQILSIKTPEEFNEKEISLRYKIYASYYNKGISKSERHTLLDLLKFKLYEVFGVIE